MTLTRRRRVVLAVLLLLTIFGGAGGVMRMIRPHGGRSPPAASRTAVELESVEQRRDTRSAAPAPVSKDRAARDELHQQIVRAVEARASASGRRSGSGSVDESAAAGAEVDGGIVDRVGGHDALVAELNHDFMPLARECIDQARERTPTLTGMVAIGLETVADEKLGAVVEAADPAPENEVTDEELLVCLRESALSLRLPPSPAEGREKLLLTLRVGDERDSSRQ
jgi:hypothetical protein